MSPTAFRKLRRSIGYSQPKLAQEMDVTTRTLTRWEQGEVTIPKMAEMALELLALKIKPKRRAG